MNTIGEIDYLLNKATKIYLSYSAVSMTLMLGLGIYKDWTRTRKLCVAIPCTILAAGVASWVHIIKTFRPEEVVLLNVGLDREYPEIKKKHSAPKSLITK